MATVKVPSSSADPKLQDGSDNPLFGLLVQATAFGAKSHLDGQTLVIEEITDFTRFTPMIVAGLVQVGGEVYDYPGFLEMTASQYGKNVPSFVPNHADIDEEENETPRSWSEWKDDNHNHNEIDGKHYVPLNGFGQDANGSVIAQLIGSGLTVLSSPEYIALLPVPTDV